MDFTLYPKQAKAFTTPANEVLYGGSAGSGKSHLMRVSAIAYSLEIPHLQTYIFRRISKDLNLNHMTGSTGFPAMLAEMIESGHVKINYSKNEIRFWNGSVIRLCYCQYEQDVMSFQGAEIGYLLIDELTHFSKTIYSFLRSRCRITHDIPDKYQGMFPRIMGATNPGGVGHAWVKAAFVDKVPNMAIEKMSMDDGGMNRQFIPALLQDNPSLDYDEYVGRLAGLGNPSLVKAMLEGDWNIVAGGMFDDLWDYDKHVVEPFKIPYTWKVNRGFDWGSSKPFAVVWFAESDGCDIELRDGTRRHTNKSDIFIVDELYGWNGKVNEGVRWGADKIAKEIIKIETNKGYVTNSANVADSAIYTVENNNCIATDMQNAGVHFVRANKSAGSRANGWQLIRDRLQNALDDEDKGIYFFNTCPQTIRTMPILPRDKRKQDDIDTEAEDHIADVIRYRCLMPAYQGSVVQL